MKTCLATLGLLLCGKTRFPHGLVERLTK